MIELVTLNDLVECAVQHLCCALLKQTNKQTLRSLYRKISLGQNKYVSSYFIGNVLNRVFSAENALYVRNGLFGCEGHNTSLHFVR